MHEVTTTSLEKLQANQGRSQDFLPGGAKLYIRMFVIIYKYVVYKMIKLKIYNNISKLKFLYKICLICYKHISIFFFKNKINLASPIKGMLNIDP